MKTKNQNHPNWIWSLANMFRHKIEQKQKKQKIYWIKKHLDLGEKNDKESSDNQD